ncbi:HAUS augmin-like complex subunit 5 isoform X1 [Montipora capricornis]|uniref:HAUS augmin-like complex subunit 5 isoform X1 n=3 Tax=Montipora TaxID=46703 RepID=UPI0035F20EC6
MAGEEVDELATTLRSWAMDEMHFRAQGRHSNIPLPSKEDFKMLCRGPMADVWKYVLEHVKSTKTVQKIKGNLKLQQLISEQASHSGDKPHDEVRDQLKQKHAKLTKKLLEVKNKFYNAEKEVKTLQKEILDAEGSYSEMDQQISDFAKRNALLTAFSKQCCLATEMYTDLVKQINDRITVYKDIARKKSTDPTYYTSQGSISQGSMLSSVEGRSTPTGLESACTRSVRESCEKIGSFLHEVCKAEEQTGRVDDGTQRKIKEQLWTGVEKILSQHPPKDVLTSLSRIAQDSAISLRELTDRIDLKQDALELKFKYENSGKLTDTSSPPSVLQSVHQLIQEGQAAHFQRFIESEKGLNEVWKGRKRLETLQQEMESILVSRYKDWPGNVELARELNRIELELVACRASLEYYKTAVNELTDDKNERQRAKEILHMKHKKIQDFEKLAESKQSLIQALVKQNSSAKARIEKQKHEHLQFIQEKICSREAHLVAMAKQLHDCVKQEVDKFATLPLCQFHFSSVESARRIPVSELSVNRLESPSAKPGGDALKTVLKCLDFPSYKAPEELLPTAMKLKAKVEAIKCLVESRDAAVSELYGDRSCDRMITRLNGLRREVTEQDRAQLEYVMPLIQNGLTKTSRAFSDCIAVKDTVTSWWEQPAQFVVPWVKLEDQNMRQWTDQWILSATRLRQLQMNH